MCVEGTDTMERREAMCCTCHNRSVFVPLVAAISIFLSAAQADDIFFIENPGGSESLATSWGFYSGDSFLQLAEDYGLGEGKFPVHGPSYKSSHSLLLKWKSAPGGDWGLAIA